MAASTERLDHEMTDAAQANPYFAALGIGTRHKWLIAVCAAIGLGLGMLHYSRQPAVYSSSAQLIVIKRGVPLNMDDGRSYNDYLQEHQLIIRSPMLVKRATEHPDFAKINSYHNVHSPVNAIIGSLSVSREPGRDASSPSNVLNLVCTGGDPEDCPRVLSVIIDSYKIFLNENFKNNSEQTMKELIKVGDAMHKDMLAKEEEIKKFREENGLETFLPAEGGRSVEETSLAALKQKRADAEFKRALVGDRIRDLKAAIAEGRGRQEWLNQYDRELTRLSSTNADGRATSQTRAERVMNLEIEKRKLTLQGYGSKHPEMLFLDGQISMIEEFYSGMDIAGKADKNTDTQVANFLAGLEKDVLLVERELRTINRLLAEEEKQAGRISQILRKEKDLDGELARMVQLYMPLQQAAKQASYQLTQDVGGFDAQVLAPPAAGGQVGPNQPRILMTGMFLGLCGGVCLAYLADFRDKSFRTPEEIRRRLGVTVIGNIPLIEVEATEAEVPPEELVLDPRLCTHYHSKSFHAEAFRGVRTALYFSTQGEVHKVIQITSPQASDGKSTVIGNLAVSIAQSGRKIILIDADLRKPRLHKMFGVSNDFGLVSVISDGMEIKDAIQPTLVPGLSIMACGPRPPNPAELLTSPVFKNFLDTIREQFDFVLIDTPPLLAVSDPSVVAPRVDGVILAIRISKNGRPNAERAREILNTLGANVLGVVVNGAGPRGSGAGAGGGYNYAHYDYGYNYDYDTYSSYYSEDTETNSGLPAQPEDVDGDTGAPSEEEPLPEMKKKHSHHRHKTKSGLLSRFWKGPR